MTPIAAAFLLAKATFLFATGLAVLRALKNCSAALRHLVCFGPIAASLLLPLTLMETRSAIPIRIPVLSRAAARSAPSPHNFGLAALAFDIWLAGAALLLLCLALGHWRLHRIAGGARTLGHHNNIPVRAANIPAPLVAGLRHPVILLPISWPALHHDAAVRHEAAHVERKDLWSSLIAGIACAVWWFHPLVWMLAARQRTEQEVACDDNVLSSGFNAASYASALLAAAAPSFHLSTLGSPMFTKNDLTKRIQRLADYKLPKPLSQNALRRITLGFAAVLACIALLGPAAAQNAPYKIGNGVTPPQVIEKVDPAYPAEARDAKVEGAVLLQVVILPAGIAGDISVVKTVDTRLDDAAIEAVRQWKFAPGTLKGEPVPVQARIEVNFRLK